LVDSAIGLLTLLAVIAASFGFGLLALRGIGSGQARLPLALVGSGGLALLCWLGGWLAATHLYSRAASLALLALGLAALALCAHDTRRLVPAASRPGAAALALAVLAGALFLVRALGSVRSPFVNPCDDWPAYFHLPKLLLETGGLDEPFSMRRLGVLGVGPLLQTFLWPTWPTRAAAIADATLGGLVVWGAARAAVALRVDAHPSPVAVEAAGLLAGVASLSMPLANGSPALLPMGGALVLLCLSTLLARGAATPRAGAAHAVLWGAVAAVVVGMRTSNIGFPGMLGLTGLALALARRDGAAMRRWLLAALAFGVALAPWSLSSWLSSATPFFPVILGNYRFPGVFSAPLSPGETLAFVASCLWACRLWFPLVLAAVVGRVAGWGGTAALTAAAISATVVATALALTASDSFNVFRYSAPFLVATVVFLFALWLGGLERSALARSAPRRQLGLVVVAAVLWTFLPVEVETHSALDDGLGPKRFDSSPARGVARSANGWRVAALGTLRRGLHEPRIAGAEHFVAAQARLGNDARILSAVSKPFFWRFDRHLVHTVDCPGQASPPPGMPFFEGPEALADYLLELGYTHLAFTPPGLDRCLYSLSHWTAAERSGVFLWESIAPYFVDFLRNEQALAAKLGSVYQSREVIVVDLRRARLD
jgi:hypothetical protein